MTNEERIVVALGGNALTDESAATHSAQKAVIRETVRALDELYAEDRTLAWVHGNGPQVGYRLLAQEQSEVPEHPLDVLVAETQGQLGYLLGRLLDSYRTGTTVTVPTRVVVDPDDPAFGDPTKPIGPWYSASEAKAKSFETADVGTGDRSYRRVVPSPMPKRVVETDQIETLLRQGTAVISCGGGGVPVVESADGLTGKEGVIDKDYTAALLGTHLDASDLIFLTDVSYAYLDYGGDDQRPLASVSPDELRWYSAAGEFGEGSMRPKAESCATFVEGGGDRALITTPADIEAALDGNAGTHVR